MCCGHFQEECRKKIALLLSVELYFNLGSVEILNVQELAAESTANIFNFFRQITV